MSEEPQVRPDNNAASESERLELVESLLARRDRDAEALAALRIRYPKAPEEMILSAAHHLYRDGPDAAVHFLAEVELSIRNPTHDVCLGPIFHLLDHLYNWLQFQALVPEGTDDLLTLIEQLRESVEGDDRAACLATLEELESVVEANRTLPEVY